MRKPKRKTKRPAETELAQPIKSKAAIFGFEEMLSELEAIVAEAQIQRRDKKAA